MKTLIKVAAAALGVGTAVLLLTGCRHFGGGCSYVPARAPVATATAPASTPPSGMSFSEVRGFGCDRIPKTDPPLVQDLVDYAPYTRIEILCADDQVSEIVWTIEQAAHTGENGDGKIYVLDVCRAVCIQTEQPAELGA